MNQSVATLRRNDMEKFYDNNNSSAFAISSAEGDLLGFVNLCINNKEKATATIPLQKTSNETYQSKVGDYVDANSLTDTDDKLIFKQTPRDKVATILVENYNNGKIAENNTATMGNQIDTNQTTQPEEVNNNNNHDPTEIVPPFIRKSVMKRIQRDLNSPSASARVRAIKALKSPSQLNNYQNFDVPHEEQSIITAEEREALAKPQPTIQDIMKDIVVYVEVRTNEDNRSAGVKKVIAALGARVNDRLLRDTTHVIFKDGLLSTFKKAKHWNIPVVSILWMEACRKHNRVCNPKNFPISNLDRYEHPELYEKIKRHKFVQPDSECNKRIRTKKHTPGKDVRSPKTTTTKKLATPKSAKNKKTPITKFFGRETPAGINVNDSSTPRQLQNGIVESPATIFLNKIINNYTNTPQDADTTPKCIVDDVKSVIDVKRKLTYKTTPRTPTKAAAATSKRTPKRRTTIAKKKEHIVAKRIETTTYSLRDMSIDKTKTPTPSNSPKKQSNHHHNSTKTKSKTSKKRSISPTTKGGSKTPSPKKSPLTLRRKSTRRTILMQQTMDISDVESNTPSPVKTKKSSRRRTLYTNSPMMETIFYRDGIKPLDNGNKNNSNNNNNKEVASILDITSLPQSVISSTMLNGEITNGSEKSSPSSSTEKSNDANSQATSISDDLSKSETTTPIVSSSSPSSTATMVPSTDSNPTLTNIDDSEVITDNEAWLMLTSAINRGAGGRRRTIFEISKTAIAHNLEGINRQTRLSMGGCGGSNNDMRRLIANSEIRQENTEALLSNTSDSVAEPVATSASVCSKDDNDDVNRTPKSTENPMPTKRKLFVPQSMITPPKQSSDTSKTTTTTLTKTLKRRKTLTPLAVALSNNLPTKSKLKPTMKPTQTPTTETKLLLPERRNRRSTLDFEQTKDMRKKTDINRNHKHKSKSIKEKTSLLPPTTAATTTKSSTAATTKSSTATSSTETSSTLIPTVNASKQNNLTEEPLPTTTTPIDNGLYNGPIVTESTETVTKTQDVGQEQQQQKEGASPESNKENQLEIVDKNVEPIEMKKKNLSYLVCTNTHRHQQELVREAIKTLGRFKLSRKVEQETTHLISFEPRRTLNLLRGLIRGLWILEYRWIKESLRAGYWLPEEPYEIKDFSRAVEICRAERQAFGLHYRCELFSALGIFYVPNRCGQIDKDSLVELIHLCGGKTTDDREKAKYILGSVNRFMYNKTYITPYWVLDSITNMQLQPFDSYLPMFDPTTKPLRNYRKQFNR